MNVLPLLIAGAAALTIGDLIAGKWVKSKSKVLYVLILLCYMIGLSFLVLSYRSSDIAVASVTLEILNVILLTIAGKYFFRENITKTEIAGIVTGMCAVLILEFA